MPVSLNGPAQVPRLELERRNLGCAPVGGRMEGVQGIVTKPGRVNPPRENESSVPILQLMQGGPEPQATS